MSHKYPYKTLYFAELFVVLAGIFYIHKILILGIILFLIGFCCLTDLVFLLIEKANYVDKEMGNA